MCRYAYYVVKIGKISPSLSHSISLYIYFFFLTFKEVEFTSTLAAYSQGSAFIRAWLKKDNSYKKKMFNSNHEHVPQRN